MGARRAKLCTLFSARLQLSTAILLLCGRKFLQPRLEPGGAAHLGERPHVGDMISYHPYIKNLGNVQPRSLCTARLFGVLAPGLPGERRAAAAANPTVETPFRQHVDAHDLGRLWKAVSAAVAYRGMQKLARVCRSNVVWTVHMYPPVDGKLPASFEKVPACTHALNNHNKHTTQHGGQLLFALQVRPAFWQRLQPMVSGRLYCEAELTS